MNGAKICAEKSQPCFVSVLETIAIFNSLISVISYNALPPACCMKIG